jgi:hypothetical protein
MPAVTLGHRRAPVNCTVRTHSVRTPVAASHHPTKIILLWDRIRNGSTSGAGQETGLRARLHRESSDGLHLQHGIQPGSQGTDQPQLHRNSSADRHRVRPCPGVQLLAHRGSAMDASSFRGENLPVHGRHLEPSAQSSSSGVSFSCPRGSDRCQTRLGVVRRTMRGTTAAPPYVRLHRQAARPRISGLSRRNKTCIFRRCCTDTERNGRFECSFRREQPFSGSPIASYRVEADQ